jgi:hypothetical protein
MSEPKVYLKNGMCPFKNGPDAPYHKCDIVKNPPSKYTEGFNTGYYCSHGEFGQSRPMAPCDSESPGYNTRLWESVNKRKPYVYNQEHEDRINNMVGGIMSFLPPIGTDNNDEKEKNIDYRNFQPYNLIKKDEDEARGYMQLRKKRCLCKLKRKPIKKTIKKKTCACVKKR